MSAIIHLDLLAGNDAGSGDTWAAAKRTFAGALAAVPTGGTINVASTPTATSGPVVRFSSSFVGPLRVTYRASTDRFEFPTPHGVDPDEVMCFAAAGAAPPSPAAAHGTAVILSPTELRVQGTFGWPMPAEGASCDLWVRSARFAVANEFAHGIPLGSYFRSSQAQSAPVVRAHDINGRLIRIAEDANGGWNYPHRLGVFQALAVTHADVGSVVLGRTDSRIAYNFGFTPSTNTPDGNTALRGGDMLVRNARTNFRWSGREMPIRIADASDMAFEFRSLTACPLTIEHVGRGFASGHGHYSSPTLVSMLGCRTFSYTCRDFAGGTHSFANIERTHTASSVQFGLVRQGMTIFSATDSDVRCILTSIPLENGPAVTGNVVRSTVTLVGALSAPWISANPSPGSRIILSQMEQAPDANSIREQGVSVTRDSSVARLPGRSSWRIETGVNGQPAPLPSTPFRMNVARVAFNAGSTVMISAWARVSRVGSDCEARLQLSGTDLMFLRPSNEAFLADGSVNSPSSAWTVAGEWQQISVAFNPSHAGVVAVDFRQFGPNLVTHLDALEVTQF